MLHQSKMSEGLATTCRDPGSKEWITQMADDMITPRQRRLADFERLCTECNTTPKRVINRDRRISPIRFRIMSAMKAMGYHETAIAETFCRDRTTIVYGIKRWEVVKEGRPRRPRPTTTKSPTKYVYYNKVKNRWIVQRQECGRSVYYGSFPSLETAARARNDIFPMAAE